MVVVVQKVSLTETNQPISQPSVSFQVSYIQTATEW